MRTAGLATSSRKRRQRVDGRGSRRSGRRFAGVALGRGLPLRGGVQYAGRFAEALTGRRLGPKPLDFTSDRAGLDGSRLGRPTVTPERVERRFKRVPAEAVHGRSRSARSPRASRMRLVPCPRRSRRLALALVMTGYTALAEIAKREWETRVGAVLAVIASTRYRWTYIVAGMARVLQPLKPRVITSSACAGSRGGATTCFHGADRQRGVGARPFRTGRRTDGAGDRRASRRTFTMEMMSQIGFTLLGWRARPGLHEPRSCLLDNRRHSAWRSPSSSLKSAQRSALFRMIERGLVRLAQRGSTCSS